MEVKQTQRNFFADNPRGGVKGVAIHMAEDTDGDAVVEFYWNDGDGNGDYICSHSYTSKHRQIEVEQLAKRLVSTLEQPTGKSLMAALSHECNGSLDSSFEDEFIEEFFRQHRTLQQMIVARLANVLVTFAQRVEQDDSAWTDARNEASAEFACEILTAAKPSRFFYKDRVHFPCI